MTPRVPRRRPIRLRGFDYTSPGAYFVTICTRNRACILGDLKAGSISLTPIGKIVQRTWAETPNHFPNVGLDEYVIMPNHLHGLLLIEDTTVGAQHAAPLRVPSEGAGHRVQPGSLGAIIRAFKSASTRMTNMHTGLSGHRIWQRAYYEHIVRDEQDLARIRAYIQENPLRWALDEENPARIPAPADR